MGWINSQQFERDHQGLRDVCAVDGQYGTEERPLALDDEGWRVHASHFTDERSGLYGHQQVVDDGKRYDLSAPRGVSPVLDKLNPTADHHTVRVYGSADLARRMAEATAAGVDISFQRVNDDTAEA